MKRTLFYELCASLVVAALLAGFNLLAEQPVGIADEVAVMPGAINIVMKEHRGGRGGHRRAGHRRHHPRPGHQKSGNQQGENMTQPTPAAPAPATTPSAPQPANPPAAQ